MNRFRNDIRLILIVAAIIAVSFLILNIAPQHSGTSVIVTVNNKETAVFPLNADTEFVIDCGDSGYNILVIENGQAHIKESDCRNQICVNTGAISSAGEMIVCMPHKVVIKIETD